MVFVRPEQPDPKSVVVSWVDELAKKHDLVDAAVHWLAGRLDQPADLLSRSLHAMTFYETGIFLESVLPLGFETGVELVSRWLIARAATGERAEGLALTPALDSVLQDRGLPWIRVFQAVCELIRQECLPVLVLTLASQDLATLERVARLLAELAAVQPRAPLILLVDAEAFDTYLAHAPASRAKALLRESTVTLTCLDLPPAVGPLTTPANFGESQSLGPLKTAVRSPEPTVCNPESRDLESDVMDPILKAVAFRRAAVERP